MLNSSAVPFHYIVFNFLNALKKKKIMHKKTNKKWYLNNKNTEKIKKYDKEEKKKT